MAKRKKRDDLGFVRPAGSLVVGASVLGVGATVVSKVGGPTAGISAAASFLPVIGVTIGGGAALRQLRKLQNPRKRKRK